MENCRLGQVLEVRVGGRYPACIYRAVIIHEESICSYLSLDIILPDLGIETDTKYLTTQKGDQFLFSLYNFGVLHLVHSYRQLAEQSLKAQCIWLSFPCIVITHRYCNQYSLNKCTSTITYSIYLPLTCVGTSNALHMWLWFQLTKSSLKHSRKTISVR